MDFRLSISVSPPPTLLSPSPVESLPPTPTATTLMPLPPESFYTSKEALYTSIQAWAAQYCYAFTIGRSKKIGSGSRTKIIYTCDRYGSVPPEKHPHNRLRTRMRHTSTRKTGCQFSLVAIEHTDSQWELRYRPGTQYNTHNHPPSQAASSHPAHRKLAQQELNQAKSLYTAGKYKLVYSF